jgi:hypothetical protein
MNKAASELGKLGKGIKKTMTPEAMKQRREASKRPRKRAPKKRLK